MDKNDPLRQVLLAAALLTRLPLPQLPQGAFDKSAKAVWAYPVIGVIVGAVGVVVGKSALGVGIPLFAAATLVIITTMALTGAMHEDGLADVFDGWWGGYTPERRLEIMRDSQVGTFGLLALTTVSLLRISAIAALLAVWWPAIIVSTVLSRAAMPVLMFGLPYARKDGLSHSVGKPRSAFAITSLALGLVISIFLIGFSALLAFALTIAVTLAVAVLAKRKIGGQTGDVLGALQQLSEVAILLGCTALL
ncbi:adenosylcobinamide-GDP ribazoletransferase [Sulfitobacter donghicola]|uniref:Adenosylcobinamide-GDP ribazoletransferase n=1 Tax=Sulfitobacter donghicola DSW-25 = KCTC 12864 = JCM 14565 TaxID=1300350 RepID=A0A073IIF8_9RHOB|nr:adenosylcobinamide-GDP ribazoletransferase [Sulfitobacter donghicola]KEJ89311.1 cobalamin 5'-phosphate synthase [Sulfitobacter donghicola DSW-25 = KCTC 12864 = JCM 14565]KIN69114.1 Cobalamin synthase [Sulfitobacter donghicola DSW-25 = KCTC 12864 = JCM 14565]